MPWLIFPSQPLGELLTRNLMNAIENCQRAPGKAMDTDQVAGVSTTAAVRQVRRLMMVVSHIAHMCFAVLFLSSLFLFLFRGTASQLLTTGKMPFRIDFRHICKLS